MNPVIQGVKKFMFDLLGGERYSLHEEMIEILAHHIRNEKDYERFGKLIAEVYEAGYVKAIDEHAAELKRLGLHVSLKSAEKKPTNPLF